MEFSLDKQTFADPKKRLLIGVLMIIICIVFFKIGVLQMGVSREECLQVEATLDECKSRSSQTDQGGFTYYLTFEDHDREYTIHSSCDRGDLIDKLLALRSGAEIGLLVDEPTGIIYELEVNGELWLSFDDAKKQIEQNMKIGSYIVYVCMAVGAVCIISAGVSFVMGRKKGDTEE